MSSIRFRPTPLSREAQRFQRLRYVGVLAAAAVAIGTLMPWLVGTDESIGVTVSQRGIDAGSSGLTVLVFAIIAGIALFVSTRLSAWAAAVCGVLALLLAASDLFPSADLVAYLGLPGVATVGFGLWVSIVGSIVLVAIAVYGAYARRDT